MKNLVLLSKNEMKGVFGGMDRETTLNYCIEHVGLDNQNPSSAEDHLVIELSIQMCYDAYYQMSH